MASTLPLPTAPLRLLSRPIAKVQIPHHTCPTGIKSLRSRFSTDCQEPATDRAPPARPAKAQPPTPRKAARLLMSDPDKLNADDRRFVTALLELSPPVARAVDLAKAFSTMIKNGLADQLDA